MARLALTFGALLFWGFAVGLRRQKEGEASQEPVVKNGKQKAWAAASILNLEHKKCGRHNFPVSHKAKWPWQSCPAGWSNAAFACRTCHGDDEGPFACWEKCGAEKGLPHLSVRCTNLWCVASSSDCVKAVTNAVVTWGSFAFNLITNKSALAEAATVMGSATTAAKDSLQDLEEVARDGKQLVNTVLKESVDKLVSDTRAQLIKMMLGGKAPSEKTQEEIIRGGAEVIALKAAGVVNEKLKGIADKFLAAVDFTAIPGVNKALEAFDGGERCRDVMIAPMPEEGLEAEDGSR